MNTETKKAVLVILGCRTGLHEVARIIKQLGEDALNLIGQLETEAPAEDPIVRAMLAAGLNEALREAKRKRGAR